MLTLTELTILEFHVWERILPKWMPVVAKYRNSKRKIKSSTIFTDYFGFHFGLVKLQSCYVDDKMTLAICSIGAAGKKIKKIKVWNFSLGSSIPVGEQCFSNTTQRRCWLIAIPSLPGVCTGDPLCPPSAFTSHCRCSSVAAGRGGGGGGGHGPLCPPKVCNEADSSGHQRHNNGQRRSDAKCLDLPPSPTSHQAPSTRLHRKPDTIACREKSCRQEAEDESKWRN